MQKGHKSYFDISFSLKRICILGNNKGIQISGDLRHPLVNSGFTVNPNQNQVSWNISWSEEGQKQENNQTVHPYQIKVKFNTLKNRIF